LTEKTGWAVKLGGDSRLLYTVVPVSLDAPVARDAVVVVVEVDEVVSFLTGGEDGEPWPLVPLVAWVA
jgi:hypothetical protein